MVSAMQRLGFTPSVTIEQRRLAVDLSEVVIKWELQRIKDQQVGSLPGVFVLSQQFRESAEEADIEAMCVCCFSLILTWTPIRVAKV